MSARARFILAVIVLFLLMTGPFLLTALIVGFSVSLIQSITQIQEVTLSFVPKAIAVALALLVVAYLAVWRTEKIERSPRPGRHRREGSR